MSSDQAELSHSDLPGQPGKERGGERQGTKTLPTAHCSQPDVHGMGMGMGGCHHVCGGCLKELLVKCAGDAAFPGCLRWWDCMEEGIGMDIVIGIRIGIGGWDWEHPLVPEIISTENNFLWTLLFPAQGLTQTPTESPESHCCALWVPVLLWVPRHWAGAVSSWGPC